MPKRKRIDVAVSKRQLLINLLTVAANNLQLVRSYDDCMTAEDELALGIAYARTCVVLDNLRVTDNF